MAKPYFSIVVPTRNRPDYLHDALYSALHQKFSDVEVIVSDNFNEPSTYENIQPFLSDPRLRYIRTEKVLSMIDHWEWASRHATGRYVIILPDRKLLYPNGVAHVHRALEKYGEVNALSYGVKLYNDHEHKMGWNHPLGKTTWFTSEELIRNFLVENYFSAESFDIYFPKTLNGCFRNEYAAKIRKQYGSYFNLPGVTTPDYSSCFINLALNERMLYIAKPVLLTQGEQVSNGRNFGRGKFDDYMRSLNLEDPYRLLPLKAPYIYNLLMNDYLVIKNKVRGNLEKFPVDMVNLFATTRYELEMKKRTGFLDHDAELYFQEEWTKGLSLMEPDVREAVGKKIYVADKAARTGRVGNFHLHLRDFVNHRFSHIGWVNRLTRYRSENALKAAGY